MVRIAAYVETVTPAYDELTFRRMFTLARSTVNAVLREIGDQLTYKQPHRGRLPVSPEKTASDKSHCFIVYGYTIHIISHCRQSFNVAEFSVTRARRNVVNALNSLAGRIIKWPSRQSTQDIVNDFKNIKGSPDVIGALDGTHIGITPPSHHPEQYINRKGFSSIQLQCVCDAKLFFTHVYLWWPESVHDARVFRNSDLWENGLNWCDGSTGTCF